MESIFIKTIIIFAVFVHVAHAFPKPEIKIYNNEFINDSLITSKTPDTIFTGQEFFLTQLSIGKNFVGFSLGAGISYAVNKNLFTFRYIGSDELQFQLFGVDPVERDSPKEKIRDLGLLYGRIFPDGNKLLSFSAGISYLKATIRGKLISGHEFKKRDITTISFPLEIQVISLLSKSFGFGLTFYANMNKEKSIFGGQLSINF